VRRLHVLIVALLVVCSWSKEVEVEANVLKVSDLTETTGDVNFTTHKDFTGDGYTVATFPMKKKVSDLLKDEKGCASLFFTRSGLVFLWPQSELTYYCENVVWQDYDSKWYAIIKKYPRDSAKTGYISPPYNSVSVIVVGVSIDTL